MLNPQHVNFFFGLFLALGMLAHPASALAQDASSGDESTTSTETVTPTDEQVELNEKAVRLIASGDAVQAITLLQEANYIGELNVTYLNLGRAYQSIGRCDEARASLEAVQDAPAVESPPPGLVNSRAKSFLQQLSQECEQGERTDAEKQEVLVPRQNGAGGPRPSTVTRGWVTIGVGAGLGICAGALHLIARSQRNQVREPTLNSSGQVTNISQREADRIEDRANTLDTIAVGTAIAAAGVTALGVYWLISSPEQDTTVHLTPTIGPNNAGISLEARF
jgi:hypothetical protein